MAQLHGLIGTIRDWLCIAHHSPSPRRPRRVIECEREEGISASITEGGDTRHQHTTQSKRTDAIDYASSRRVHLQSDALYPFAQAYRTAKSRLEGVYPKSNVQQSKLKSTAEISHRPQNRGPSRTRPTQTFTQPSAPAMQAPSHAISASPGTSTPCTRGYASSRTFPELVPGGGKSRGRCAWSKCARVCVTPEEPMSERESGRSSAKTYRLLTWAGLDPAGQAHLADISAPAHCARCMRRRGRAVRTSRGRRKVGGYVASRSRREAGASRSAKARSLGSPWLRPASTRRSCLHAEW